MYRIVVIVLPKWQAYQKIGEILMWVQVKVAHTYFTWLWFPGMEPKIAQAYFS